MLKNIENLAKDYDLDLVKKELKNIQSIKCRFKKMKDSENYEDRMTEILKTEQTLKEIKNFLSPNKKFVTEYDENDIKNLNYDETQKAIKSIQSKKCLSQNYSDKSEYEMALKIEQMLIDHRNQIKPIDEYSIKKSEIQDLIEHIETLDKKISKDYIIKQLQTLID